MTAMDDLKKRYKPMENVLNQINAKVISLQDSEKKRNNRILKQVTNTLIALMKQKDPLFGAMYERQFHGGSYYDNLKVGNPNEYDLDLVLNLPVLIEPRVKCSDQPGWVKIEIVKYTEMSKRPEVESKKYEKLHTLMENANYLSTNKVLMWMERIINLSFNDMPKNENNCTYVDVVFEKDKPPVRVFVKMSKGAPAFTVKLSGKDMNKADIQLDIDFVPCFQFTDKINWPDKSGGYRSNPSTVRNKFLVVPKKPKGEKFENSPTCERYWRLSFQEQERDLIGQNLKTLKPSLRLLKKLRDRHNHKIASYFIKTVFLWTLEEEPITFWGQSLSVVFMSMLKKYAEMVREKTIPYYWNKNLNLIENLNDATKIDLANTLQNIIVDVEKKLSEILIDPFTIGKYLLQLEEFEKFKQEVTLPKKIERSISCAATNAVLTAPVCPANDIVDSGTPLEKLKFESDTIVIYRQMSDLLEEKDKMYLEFIREQISPKPNGVSHDTEILASLRKIDEKMDKILEKFDRLQENNREHETRIVALEEQIRQLHMENRNLRKMVYETEPNEIKYYPTPN